MGLVSARGMFMSANAPIRISLGSLAEFLEGQGEKDSRSRIDAVLAANPSVFALEEVDDEKYLVTTREGRAPQAPQTAPQHTFTSRFHTPLPKPERTAQRVLPRPEVAFADVLAELDDLQVEEPPVPRETQTQIDE